MPRIVALGGVVLLTSALGAHAEPPPCPPTAPEGCRIEQRRPVQRTILNACLTETRCVREETEKKGYTVQTKDVETEVPYTRQVPVIVTDPCTGQKRTEMRTETVMQKATTTYIVILPPECPATTTKKVEQKKFTLQIKVGHRPDMIEEKVPVPCGKKCP